MEYSPESLDYTMEGYVGKTKETERIEKACAAICKEYKDASIAQVSLAKIHDSKEIREIERAIEDLTGFRRVNIIVKNDKVFNAYTMPGSMCVKAITNKMPNMPTAHGKKYYDESHGYYCMIVLHATIFAELEPDECTAIILHEVGHNFDHTMTNWLFDLYVWAITLPSGPLSALFNIYRTEIQTGIETIVKILDYIPIFPLFANYIGEGLRALDMLLGPLGATTTIYRLLTYAERNPGTAILGMTRVHQETFADSYVNSLGYGDPMIRAINKIDTRNYSTKINPAIELWTGAGQAASAILLMFMDPHPENQTRAKNILDDMKRASEDKDMPAHVRKAIKEDYKRQKKAYDDFLKVDPDERNAVITRFARRFKESLFGGRVDFRVVLMNLLGGTSAMRNR
jgi:Zn-dependent protease with chaperone function